MSSAAELAAWFSADARDLASALNEEERSVLVLCSKGLKSSAVGANLNHCTSWVESKKRSAFEKLGVGSLVEAAVVMTKAGLV